MLERACISKDALESLAEKQKKEAQEELSEKKLQALKERWQCWDCGKGHLRLVMFPIRGGAKYYRQCSQEGCGNRTKMKPWNPEVEE